MSKRKKTVVRLPKSKVGVSKEYKTHPCIFIGTGATQEQCHEMSSVVSRNKKCGTFACKCKWRLCSACVSHGIITAHSQVSMSDPETGLCNIHLDKGEDYKIDPLSFEDKKQPKNRKKDRNIGNNVQNVVEYSRKIVDASKKLKKAIDSAGEAISIHVTKIRRYENQPRKVFDEEDLINLGHSIKYGAQIQAIYVRKVDDDPDHDYELVDGERRWRACRLVGVSTLRAFVLDIDDEDLQYMVSAIANFGRKDHTHVEAAYAMDHLVSISGLSVEEAAKLFGKTMEWGYKHLSILKLDSRVQEMINPALSKEKQLTFSVATTLAGYPDQEFQYLAASHIVGKELGLHHARRYIKKLAADMGKRSERIRKRKPSDEYKLLKSFIDRFFYQVDGLLAVPDDVFLRMFPDGVSARTDRGNLDKIRQRIERLIRRIEGVKVFRVVS